MNRSPVAPRRRVLVLALALLVAAACAGSAGVSRAPTTRPRRSSPARPNHQTDPDPTDPRAGGSTATTADPGGPALNAAGCAAVTRLYAELVAVPLGLDDDPDPADRAAVAADSARVRALVPVPVAHDLDVVARVYGAEARALGDAGSGPATDLDRAGAALAGPEVRAAVADLDRRLAAGCGHGSS